MLIAFSIASYTTVARDGFKRLVDTLESKAERIVTDPQFRLNDIEALAHQFAGPEIYVQVRNASGTIIDRTPNLGINALPVNVSTAPSSDSGSAWVDIVFMNDERRLVYNQPIANQEGDYALLQISNLLTDHDRSLSNLARVLVVGNLLTILAAFGTGWWLAGVGLRPIFRLAQAMLTIGHTRDFAQRINYTGTDDEIGQLAATFDQMLAELEDAHRQTEQTLQTQRRFVADASHELRTPLTTVRGNLDLLRREPPISDPDRMAVLADLVEESDRLIRMVNHLLVLARADVQPPEWQEPVSLKSVFDHVQRQVKQLALTVRSVSSRWCPNRSLYEAMKMH
ncbi:MAG: histidine kinase dimerization/phospho-acceptor domain-containing protein [Caldilineaceae bacterium]